LVDGAEVLPRIASEVRKARSHVHIAGWHVGPYFALTRDGNRTELRALLEELAERVDVRVLLWAGSPLPLFHPDREDVDGVRHALEFGTKIRLGLDAKERPMHCHHEKLVIVDDRVAFVGGVDLTTLGGDRFDTNAHVARGTVGWHDAAAELRGPIVRDVAEHFRVRWQAVTAEELPEPKRPRRAGDVQLQLVRTVPERIYNALPRGEFRILEAYTRALRAAQKLVYLENQFYWSSEIAEILEGKLANPPSDEFRIVLVLPVDPNNGGDDTRGQLARRTRLRLWAEHLETNERSVAGDSTTVIDEQWRPLAEEQRRRREHGEPQTHRLSELPHLSRRTRRLLGPVQGLLVDG
jgi:phosphatidylserine/phosphatidylglycerophosphate/cardiolipin synthase-like enzyme